MMEKAAGSAADFVFLDLEDACAPAEKVPARKLVVDALLRHDFGRTTRAVRINDASTQWCYRDIIDIVGETAGHLDAIVIPKVASAAHVHFVSTLLDGLERELSLKTIKLHVQIESPQGAVLLREISTASERVEAIVFGPGDYAAGLGVAQLEIGMIDPRYPGHQWHWVMGEIAAHAKAVFAQAIDGPYVDFRDEAGYRDSATRARLLGFDGKWCIHPNQIPWANEVFAPTAAEAAEARAVIDAYDSAVSDGVGAIALDGKLIDEASRKVAEGVIARAEAVGLN